MHTLPEVEPVGLLDPVIVSRILVFVLHFQQFGLGRSQHDVLDGYLACAPWVQHEHEFACGRDDIEWLEFLVNARVSLD